MKNKNGVSLIVLVITIIVMIILAASIVITLSNTGIIDKAQFATDRYNQVLTEQQTTISGFEDYLDNKQSGNNGQEDNDENINLENNYVVEIGNKEYVTGKQIVLVYTNNDSICFNYGEKLMLDVTGSGYKYNDVTEYEHVYGYVTDTIVEGTLENYKENIKSLDDTSDVFVIDYTLKCDVNFSGEVNLRDVAVIQGVINVTESTFSNYMQNVLKSDVNGDKCVNETDFNIAQNEYTSSTN